MAKDKIEVGVVVKQCKDCEYNLKCDDCFYRDFAKTTVKEIIFKAYLKLAKTICEDYPEMRYYLDATIEELGEENNG